MEKMVISEGGICGLTILLKSPSGTTLKIPGISQASTGKLGSLHPMQSGWELLLEAHRGKAQIATILNLLLKPQMK